LLAFGIFSAAILIYKTKPQGGTCDELYNPEAERGIRYNDAKLGIDWKNDRQAFYDTRKPGLSNQGHYKMFLNADGSELLSADEKKDLIEFLKTL
jgi:hypothetical protein